MLLNTKNAVSHVAFDLLVRLAEDRHAGQALALVRLVQLLEVGQFLVAARAATGQPNQHRTLVGQ